MPYRDPRRRRQAWRARNEQRYHERRARALAELGGKCVQCGSTSELEFDHIDPSTKVHSLNQLFSGGSQIALDFELLKCQLLCKDPCHIEKSRRDGVAHRGRMGWRKRG